jgi:hypothetical protein
MPMRPASTSARHPFKFEDQTQSDQVDISCRFVACENLRGFDWALRTPVVLTKMLSLWEDETQAVAEVMRTRFAP